MLLADLGALVPDQFRTDIRKAGGLRTWMQNFPGLFQVSGQPGKESVSLMVSAKSGSPGTFFQSGSERQSTSIPSSTSTASSISDDHDFSHLPPFPPVAGDD